MTTERRFGQSFSWRNCSSDTEIGGRWSASVWRLVLGGYTSSDIPMARTSCLEMDSSSDAGQSETVMSSSSR